MISSKVTAQRAERARISIILAVTLIGVTLFRFVDLPTVTWGVQRIFGSPLRFSIGGDWLLTLLTIGLIATGTYALVHEHPESAHRERPLIFALISPSMGALLVSLLLVQSYAWPVWLGTLLLGAALLGWLIHLSYRTVAPDDSGNAGARVTLNILNYLIGFILFTIILGSRERALITGPALVLVGGLLSLELLSASGASLPIVLLFSGILALLLGEMAWVLGYWPISSWTSATLLTLVLYLWSGIGYQYLLDRLTPRVVLEFAGGALLVFVLIVWARP